MLKFNKIIKSILFFFLIFELTASMLPAPCSAESYTVEVPITDKADYELTGGKAIGTYIGDIYKFAIAAVGIIAAVVMMYGGVLWIVAGGNQEKISEAKAWIGAALTGLFLFMTSYIILNLINPNLTKFQAISPAEVSKMKDTDGTSSSGCLSSGAETDSADKCCSKRYSGTTKTCLASLPSGYCSGDGDCSSGYWCDMTGGDTCLSCLAQGGNCTRDRQCCSGLTCKGILTTTCEP